MAAARMENMKTPGTATLTETAARYNMTAYSFEKLLSKVGWIDKDGELMEEAVRRGFVTRDRRVTVFGQGYLYEASRE